MKMNGFVFSPASNNSSSRLSIDGLSQSEAVKVIQFAFDLALPKENDKNIAWFKGGGIKVLSVNTCLNDYQGRNQKLEAIKEIRKLTGLSLKETKDIVEGAFPIELKILSCFSMKEVMQILHEAAVTFEFI